MKIWNRTSKRQVLFSRQLVLLYTLIFGVVLLTVFTTIYYILINSRNKEAQLNNQALMNQSLKQAERFISNMDNLAYNVMINEKLIRKFGILRDEKDPQNHFDKDMLNYIDTVSILATINGRYDPAWRISAYNGWGDFISTGALTDEDVVNSVLKQKDIISIENHMRAADEPLMISAPMQDTWSHYFTSQYISLTRPIMNTYSKDIVGLVDIQQNLTVFEEYLKLSSERELFLNIYDGEDNPILIQSHPDDVVIASAISEQYHWKMDLLEPKNSKNKEQMHLLRLMATFWLFIAVIFNRVTHYIVTRMTKPLTDLTQAVRGINVSAPHKIQIPENKIYEAISLQTDFNNMLEQLVFSMEQEKISFLLAMQAQMNPHFLYNVLSVIHAIALDLKNDAVVEVCSNSIVEICNNLSTVLRYSSSYEQKFATIREELEQTKAYLELMKSRYDYMFQYSIDLDQRLKDVTVPKLIIQPLCENCFMHAFSNMEPPYQVDIQVKTVESGWSVLVTDNGVGFDDEARKRTLERVNNIKYEDLIKMQFGGLGLVSSVARLKIMLQKEVFCEVQSNKYKGSNVRIVIKDSSWIEKQGI